MSTIVKSASKPSLINPLFFIPKILIGFSQTRLINWFKVNFPSFTWFSITGINVCTPGIPDGELGYSLSLLTFKCGA